MLINMQYKVIQFGPGLEESCVTKMMGEGISSLDVIFKSKTWLWGSNFTFL